MEQHSGGVSKDACVHQLFEAQVKRTPNAIAVVLGDEQLTYWALNQRANQLAIICNNWESLQKSWWVSVERSRDGGGRAGHSLKAGGAYVLLILSIERATSLCLPILRCLS